MNIFLQSGGGGASQARLVAIERLLTQCRAAKMGNSLGRS